MSLLVCNCGHGFCLIFRHQPNSGGSIYINLTSFPGQQSFRQPMVNQCIYIWPWYITSNSNISVSCLVTLQLPWLMQEQLVGYYLSEVDMMLLLCCFLKFLSGFWLKLEMLLKFYISNSGRVIHWNVFNKLEWVVYFQLQYESDHDWIAVSF